MRTYLTILLLAAVGVGLLTAARPAAQITWVALNDTQAKCTFSIPNNYSTNSAEQTNAYVATGENLTFEAHFVNTDAVPNMSGQSLQAPDPNARYDQLVQATAQVTGGQVEIQENFFISGRPCREARVLFTNEDGEQSRMYVLYVWVNRDLCSFSAIEKVSNNANATPRPAAPVAVFFDSVQFY